MNWKPFVSKFDRRCLVVVVVRMAMVMTMMVVIPYGNNYLRVGRSHKDNSKECSNEAGE